MSLMVNCPECGKEFYKPVSKWAYGECCSYTCYDHFKLRSERRRLNPDKYFEWVDRCEASMKHQGKTILNPITKEEIVKNKINFWNPSRSKSFNSMYSSTYYHKKKPKGE